MVLGLRAKNRGAIAVPINYLVHIQEIKPWPPSQSFKSLRAVLIQWENGDRSSGSTNSVVPSLGSIVGEGKIEFNESFRVPVSLLRDMSVKAGESEVFQKNCLEFNLYEPRRDKTVKGQLLATAIIDLAEYGVLKEALTITAPMYCKRSYRNMDQPLLYITLQSIDRARTNSLSRDSLSRVMSMDHGGRESVSALMNEEYADEAEVAPFTDDEGSSHSSVAASSNGGLHPRNEENGVDPPAEGIEGRNRKQAEVSKLQLEKENLVRRNQTSENMKRSSSQSSLLDLSSSDLGSPQNSHPSAAHSPNSSSGKVRIGHESHGVHSFSLKSVDMEKDSNTRIGGNSDESSAERNHDVNGRCQITDGPQEVKKLSSNGDSRVNGKNDSKTKETGRDILEEDATSVGSYDNLMEDKEQKDKEKHTDEKKNLEERSHLNEHDLSVDIISGRKQSLGSHTSSASGGNLGLSETILKIERLKNVKSVRADSGRNVSNSNNEADAKESIKGDPQNSPGNFVPKERKDTKVFPRDTRSAILESKMQRLEHRIKMLEGELTEAAAVEASLYSVVAEHGSSASKVHAPARRLSRLYLHACRENSQSRRANAARSAVSGLVLVAKACGNDVPRLTFWLSNSVVLRAIISQAAGKSDIPLSAGSSANNTPKVKDRLSSPLKWKMYSPIKREGIELLRSRSSDWEDPHMFTSALEKIEAWIFSRIVESIWWQTLTPHMQSVGATEPGKEIGSTYGSTKSYNRIFSSGDQEQGSFSLDLWKKAFRDSSERLCPVRTAGHECGCLPMLARLVMEQCVSRLDVAMFNAILRESGDEIPTDPVSDPISDSQVLPIPSGTSSFGAGAQLKTAIGNWSRWLTDIFGMDEDDSPEELNGHNDDDERQDTSFKSFHLLNALSDLMMLPKDMLLSKSIRKEVCPTFGAPLIKRVLDVFVPDEFCPDPIPDVVFEALESEDSVEAEDAIDFPCSAASIAYSPPSTAHIASIIGEVGGQPHLRRSGSSVLRKSYTSDDELDELNSPLALILNDGPRSSPAATTKTSWISKEKNNQNAVRYELLRDVWMESE